MSSDSARAVLGDDPVALVQPTEALYHGLVQLSKSVVDPVAHSVSNGQQQRLQESRKRKRGKDDAHGIRLGEVLRLNQVYTDGFGFEQIWAQTQQVVDATAKEVEALLAEVQALKDNQAAAESPRDDLEDSVDPQDESDDIDFDDEAEDLDGVEEEDEVADEDLMSGVDDALEVEDEDESLEDGNPAEEYVQDSNGLNDGFFSIDDFNKQSEFLERQDAKGDPDDGAASDEEDVDWAADPLADDSAVSQKAKALAPAQQEEDLDDVDDEDDDGGPTFGEMDLDAAEGMSDQDAPDYGDAGDFDTGNANNIMYTDFFAPPARKASKKRGRPHPHNFPQQSSRPANGDHEEDEDLERAMRSVQNDLFPSEDEEDEEDEAAPLDPGDPKSRRSTHERRQAALAEEIRKLEAENVSKRKWTLAGEARAGERPINSLLEEDLDFERIGKPVAPITQEVNDDIEAMIKRRILAREFDEVIRRRPDSLLASTARRGKTDFELSDQKSAKGLADEYAEEHLRRTDANFVDVKDERLKKEHKEIETMWKDVSAKLDALSSWHYKPKPVQPALEVRVDAPALALEDARPTAGSDVALASALAPQEVYKPGEAKVNGEIVTKGGRPVARDELSREEKKSRRMREKERMRKASGNASGTSSKAEGRKKEQSNIIGDLKKGGVKLIGKKGELTEVDGKAAGKGHSKNAGFLKL